MTDKCNWYHCIPDRTSRSENDSTLSQPKSENVNISWVWPFHIVICFMINCIMPPNCRQQCDFLAQAYYGKFRSTMEHAKIGQAWPFSVATCFMVLCTIPQNFRPIAEILKELTVMSSLGLGPSLFWKIQSSMESAKIGRAWPFLIETCFMLLCIIPPNYRPIAEILKELEW